MSERRNENIIVSGTLTMKSQLKILESNLAEKERRAKKLSILIEIDDVLTVEKDAFKTVELNGEIKEYRE